MTTKRRATMPSHPGGRSLRIVSIDPARPAEITAPILLGQCDVCQVDDKHLWRLADTERFNGWVLLRRYVCDCDVCGRCDARLVKVRIDRGFLT